MSAARLLGNARPLPAPATSAAPRENVTARPMITRGTTRYGVKVLCAAAGASTPLT